VRRCERFEPVAGSPWERHLGRGARIEQQWLDERRREHQQRRIDERRVERQRRVDR